MTKTDQTQQQIEILAATIAHAQYVATGEHQCPGESCPELQRIAALSWKDIYRSAEPIDNGKADQCPKSNQRSSAFPGIDQCEHCGKMVRTRQDGTYSAHKLPKDMR